MPAGAYVIKVPSYAEVHGTAGAAGRRRTATGTVESARSPGPAVFMNADCVASAKIDGLSLTLQPGAKLSGRVAFDGAPQRCANPASTPDPRGKCSAAGRGGANRSRRPSVIVGHAPGRYVSDRPYAGGEHPVRCGRWHGTDRRADAAQGSRLIRRHRRGDVYREDDRLAGTVGRPRCAEGDATVVIFPADVQNWFATACPPEVVTGGPMPGAYDLRCGRRVSGCRDSAGCRSEINPTFVKRLPDRRCDALAFGDAKPRR
jgi:hypothetical protein